MKVFVIALLGCLSIPGWAFSQYCSSDNRFTEADWFSAQEIDSSMNVQYGNAQDWIGSNTDLYLDIYYPNSSVDNMAQRPFILLIHGGGFIIGDKDIMHPYCRDFAKKGFVVATMSYRLGIAPNNFSVYRAQQDAHAAMRFMVDQADTYGVDTSWLFIGGRSAGSITALNLVYADQAYWNSFAPNVVNDLGDIDNSSNNLTHTFTLKGIFNNWGNVSDNAVEASEMLPMISYHGEMDPIVPIDNSITGDIGSRILHDRLSDESICSDLTVDPSGSHEVYDTEQGIKMMVRNASCFFKSVFCGNCASGSRTDSVSANCSVVTSVAAASPEAPVRVFPNPFKEKIQVEGVQNNPQYCLVDTKGRIVFKGQALEDIQFDGLSAGVYILHINNDGKPLTYKMVKE